jgi:hypothetical protein
MQASFESAAFAGFLTRNTYNVSRKARNIHELESDRAPWRRFIDPEGKYERTLLNQPNVECNGSAVRCIACSIIARMRRNVGEHFYFSGFLGERRR